jgi:predicted RNase H-like HicB family nuclease
MENEVIRGKAQIQQDPDGERIIVFPSDFCEKADIRTGDIYNIDIVNGEIIMTFIKRPDVKLQYPIAIYPGDEQTAFSVFFPDIPGCFSAGDSLNDALKNANEALALHLEGLSEIPTATRIDEHVNKPEYKGCVWCITEYMK